MNKTYLLHLLVLAIFLNSCYNADKKNASNKNEIEFVINGKAKNGEGKKLALHILSQNVDNRLVTTIENGVFMFKGKLPSPERAVIAFDHELEEFDGMYSSYDIFLTNDTIVFEVEIAEKYDNLYFEKHFFSKGDINKYYADTYDEFWDSFNGSFVTSNQKVMDSLKANVYPEVRRKVLKTYNDLFSSTEHSIVGLSYLRQILENNEVFDLNDLSEKEKDVLKKYFYKIKTDLKNTPDYIITQSVINRLDKLNSELKFIDFSLQNRNGDMMALSDIVKVNDYTLLYFWWSGCAPCRKFNREGQSDYELLKSKGIEIVGINNIDGMKQWKKNSRLDSLKWVDLYAGDNSKIAADYGVSGYPTKIIFDKNFKPVKFDFNTCSELLNLVEAN